MTWGQGLCPAHPWVPWPLPVQEQRQQPARESLLDAHRHEAAARRKAREQKARQARQAAIQVPGGRARARGHLPLGDSHRPPSCSCQELQQKRAQKSSNTEPGLPQEPWRAGASGTPRPAIKTNNANGGEPSRPSLSSRTHTGLCPSLSSRTHRLLPPPSCWLGGAAPQGSQGYALPHCLGLTYPWWLLDAWSQTK